MCGVVGIVGQNPVAQDIYDALIMLHYCRAYKQPAVDMTKSRPVTRCHPMMFFTATIPSGMYINRRFRRCHKPSFAMTVPVSSSLSDITNNVKNSSASTKHAILIPPVTPSLTLNDRIAVSNGTKRKSMNPVTEPTPWIFEDTVTSSLVSLTLKKHVNIHAPTANTAMKTASVTVSPGDTG